jgi:hypothetical protein
MIHCISQKMSPEDFEGHDETSKEEMAKTKTDRNRYYEKLGSAMFGVCLPGLGYDTFRMWELLTMGTVIILERAVGFDRTVIIREENCIHFVSCLFLLKINLKTFFHINFSASLILITTSPLSFYSLLSHRHVQLWRLPALLLDDFDEITPELLRSAYVEALYRADEFEFQRLTQGYWNTIVANVSATKSTQTLLDAFPMKAEKPNFARPRVPYACGVTGTCGEGTKRTPKSSC